MTKQRGLSQTKLSASQIAEMLPRLTVGESLAIRVWNQLQGIDWGGLEVLVELHDIRDPEALVADLLTIRNAKETTQAS